MIISFHLDVFDASRRHLFAQSKGVHIPATILKNITQFDTTPYEKNDKLRIPFHRTKQMKQHHLHFAVDMAPITQ